MTGRTTRRAARRLLRWAAGLLLALAPALPAAAQVVERPVPFDADGRVLVLTPSLVTRLELGPPEWPVQSPFDEARVYRTGDSSFVLVVRRGDLVERYPLTAAEYEALGRRIAAAAAVRGMPTQEAGTAGREETARGEFVRSQTARGLWLYGPAAAWATESAEAWILTSAATFFAAQAIGRSVPITVPMASLSADFGPRAALATVLLLPPGTSLSGGAGIVFGTSLAGAVAGFQLGKQFTAAEAEALSWGSTSLAIATAGLTASATENPDPIRYLTTAALVAGMPLGLQYPRKASYVLTSGDLYAMRVPQAIGAGAGFTIALAADANPRGTALLATVGYLAGAVAGDRLIAKPYDFTTWQAGLLGTGATLSAYAASVLTTRGASPDGTVVAGAMTAAAAIGAVATAKLMEVRPGRVAGQRVGVAPSRGPRVQFDPSAALAAAVRTPGRHAVLRVAF